MKVKQLTGLLRGLDDFDLKDCCITTEILDALDAQPVVKAKWELDIDNLPICSNCGEIALQRIFVKIPRLIQDVRFVKSNFCPNCGARMDGVDDG